MARRKLTEAARHSGGAAAAARWQGCAKQLEKSSSPRREIGGEGNRITGDTGKSAERREGARLMRCYPVSSRVNHVVKDDEACSKPVELAQIQSSLFS
jgi:hypothetical protein